jgi:Autotransporter beta-domain
LRFNFAGDWPAPQAAAPLAANRSETSNLIDAAWSPSGPANGGAAKSPNRSNAANDGKDAAPKTQPLKYVEPKEWLLWADVRFDGVSGSSSRDTLSALSGRQINVLIGLTRKVAPDFLVGVLGGYETFHYSSDTLSGRLTGDGWTAGTYLGWKVTPDIRLNAAAAYSGIGYNGAAGVASGDFDGDRWLVSGGLTGVYKVQDFEFEPSAKVFALWENENTYRDSLGTLQDSRTFFTGRTSAGMNLIYPWVYDASVTLAPSLGFYGDYYFNGDNAGIIETGNAAAISSTPVLTGFSGRATAGFAAHFADGATIDMGAELGGIGGNTSIWTFQGRASIRF